MTDVYFGRGIYLWKRNSVYEIGEHFVRIDILDGWLRAEN
jgi:hypothetical protein